MQTVQTSVQKPKDKELEAGWGEQFDCVDIRKQLDDLFGGRGALEATPPHQRQRLFRHLETCGQCCRSFDARVRFRSPQRHRII